jgi:peptidoglycan/LPS O-acetylase OafA/YrhL
MRLQSIDSLRGIAALGVVVFHLCGGLDRGNILTEYGRTGVFLFFVISGFCIHLKTAKGHELDFVAFWKRRWVRLYPAYLASIILYIYWAKFNGFLIYDLIMHLLMLHNWDARTVYSMNAVWWTLAIEEQLYFLYFFLLWMRRRWGWNITLLITLTFRFLTLAVSLGLHQFGVELPFTESAFSNWWLWALGAVAVEAYAGKVNLPNVLFSKVFAAVVLVSTAVLHYLGELNAGTFYSRLAASVEPVFWGIGFFVLLNWAVKEQVSFRFLAFVGIFSYSLYLTHEVVIKMLEGLNIFVVGAICLVFAYGFFRLFERPFMKPVI